MHRRLMKPIWTFAAEAGGEGGEGGAEGGSGGGTEGQGGGEGQQQGQQEQTFTQADVDRIVKQKAEALLKKQIGDLDLNDLKAKAEASKTAEERIAGLEKQIKATEHEALRRRVQAKHGISDEDADLFLTGADEDALTAQAKRLADRESQRKKQGNRVPKEGASPTAKSGDEREFVRNLFGNG